MHLEAVALTTLTMFGASVLLLGLRGRVVGMGPSCRGCGFDLAGGHERCPECGRVVTRGSVRISRRRARRGLVAAGIVMLVAAAAIGTAWGWSSVTGFDWNTAKPEWWLEAQIESDRLSEADAALRELARRAGGDLSRDRERRLVARALSIQSDLNAPWHPAWGVLVERVRREGRLSDEQWGEYLRGTLRGLELMPTFDRERKVIVVGLKGGPQACSEALPVVWSATLRRLVVNGVEEYDEANQGRISATLMTHGPSRAQIVMAEIHSEVPAGRIGAESHWELVVSDDSGYSTPLFEVELEYQEAE
jgi:hypothetical protein